MREILFRGKRTDNGEWAEGYYVYDESGQSTENSTAYIVHLHKHPCGWQLLPFEVIPESVSEFTGLCDKNGKKIFEGDIIRYTRTNMFAPSCSFHNQDLVSLHLVLWDSSVSAFVQQHYTFTEKRLIGKGSAVLYDDRAKENIIEIIGNIHDNPELLKEGDE